MKYLLVLSFILVGCQPFTEEGLSHEGLNEPLSEVWVCHNPHSSHHGKVCSDECFAPGAPHKYCWLLTSEDCTGNRQLEWQVKSCPLLEAGDK